MQAEKITALYVRFSHDENTLGDSNSVAHQKMILTDYATAHGFTNCRIYADDGYTGVNFDRPDFQRMMTDIENGFVGTVIVKDLSRLGRNYLMVGQYTEMVFPSYGVRFIAINDNVDSAEGTNDLIPFSNLMNEWYSRDISKKIRASVYQKGHSGKRLITKQVYGYLRDPDNKDNWIIDEYAAGVVRRIFDLYISGHGVEKIARILRDDKIVRPKMYFDYHYQDLGVQEFAYEWGGSTITTIIKRREYCGDTVNFKTRKLSYKSKKVIYNPPEEYVVFENTHPAIIDRETFEKAQEIHRKRFRKHPLYGGDDTPFAGYIFCMDCKSNAYICRNRKKPLFYAAYECTAYHKRYKHKNCFLHRTPYRELEAYVTTQLIRLFYMAIHDMSGLKAMVNNSIEKTSEDTMKAVKDELETAETRVTEINNYIQKLFETKVRGEIDAEVFATLSKTYADEKNKLNERITELLEEEQRLKKETSKINRFYSALKKHGDFHELTHELVRDLIDRIEIGALTVNPETNEKTRKIDIYYVGVGLLKFD